MLHGAFNRRSSGLLSAADRRISVLAVACCRNPDFSKAPPPRLAGASFGTGPLAAPEANTKRREEKRFSRADKNKDGKTQAEEVLGARRKAFAKLDANGNGSLSFDEWAAKTIKKF